ncbi:methionine--tRNA ligase [Porphyromonas gingivalis]|uniref:methionine--tRNA ligase n=1 Tax=Porphyromonas gingivalis TaxID=837 RepID=UPI0024DF6A0D|nr:methionine--tRNA ligase [Porphyromonas gingivalis]MDP0530748.1 methionine--tRNA ligase [Porphyromonas gingivalis]MDP0624010.1 methionine--tRNA ligase [Porphyromonas gingivalis]WIM91652.1 methionine--tRNA ligase [Porphyromonas gingivalis]WKD52936.1 methionine--tRNA ligase [Porphyromonas gingivalis]WKD54985.1 methionine--tRNA ligase [Porphyromonas gingivalis]
MDRQFKRTLITTALPYANGPVHIGHLAGVYVPADIYARYLRLRGRDCLLIGGSDEHGVPIALKAKAEGCTPQEVVDRYHELIKRSFEGLGISFDIYSRTTSDIHRRTASEFFKTLYEKGEFVEQTSEQYYDEEAKQFLADRYIIGTCPHCSNDRAYGDQCEACGTSLNATDLIDPRSTISGSAPVLRETKHWYLPLDKHEPFLKEWILDGHKEWKSNVYGQCKSWLDMGLQPRAVSRDLDWGIPVPVEGAEGKVLYVWFDAPIGYISNTKELCPDSWETWWKSEDTRLVHFIGKDNIVFHCIVFPAMLRAEGSFILPDNVPANEFLNLEGDKISTSRNWAVWLHEYLEEFPGKQDVLRYVLTANAPETKDNDFTWRDFQARNNNELVAIFGNFVNRALVLTHKYFDGAVPPKGELTDYDSCTIGEFAAVKQALEHQLDTFHFREALKEAMNLARIGNKYLADTEPWKLAKTDMNRVATILNLSLQITANLAIAFEPFLPFSSAKLMSMLSTDCPFGWDRLGSTDLLPEGHVLGNSELLFEKLEDSVIDAQIQKLQDTKLANEKAAHQAAPIAEDIAFEDFLKLDIRVGTVLECEKVPKADKLLRFRIDDGLSGRTIVSGIAKHYAPEELVGKQVCFIANLPPRKLKGIESEGMILSAEDADGSLRVIMPAAEVAPGSQVK